MHTDEHRCEVEWEPVTGSIIGCAFNVANTLGAGFLDKVYENALAHELRKAGHKTVQQYAIKVHYDGVVVGRYEADLLIDEVVLVELKACRGIDDVHRAQCMNYLRATALPVCLLLNFGTPRIQIKRILNPEVPAGWVQSPSNFDSD